MGYFTPNPGASFYVMQLPLVAIKEYEARLKRCTRLIRYWLLYHQARTQQSTYKKKFVQFVVCFEAKVKYCLVLLSFDVLMVTELLIFSRTATHNLFMQKHQKTFPEIE